jgi:hypothetical protein
MCPDEVNEVQENKDSATDSKQTLADAASDKQDLVNRQKEEARKVKLKSGISDTFGRPELTQDIGAKPRLEKKPEERKVITLEPVTIVGQLRYRGEGIQRDVDPMTWTVAEGDTLESIAKKRLGTDASKDEVEKYVKEITKHNQLTPPVRLSEGQELKLPGHTKDGGYVTRDDKGNTTTLWKGGRERVVHPGGDWYECAPLPLGGWREEHGGHKRPEENFVLVTGKDGRFALGDESNLYRLDLAEPAGKQELSQLAEEKIEDPERLAKFRADMARLEERMKSHDNGWFEATQTYTEVKRLLDAEGNHPLTPEERLVLAEQVMSQAASPGSIDQGKHGTCNVAAVEARTYTRSPAQAARLVREVATTGRYTPTDGPVVEINPDQLKPDREASMNPPLDNARSHASQVFQITAVNIAYAQQNAESDPPGKVRYEQRKPGDDDVGGGKVGYYPPDSGERVVDYSKDPPEKVLFEGKPLHEPGLKVDQIVDISTAITGELRGDHVLIHHKENLIGGGRGATGVQSEADLNKVFQEAKEKGTMPVIVQVDTRWEPFWTDSGAGEAGGSGGTHVVTITEYNEGPPATVGIDDQWGSKSDHRSVPVSDLYLATMNPKETPSSLDELRENVANQNPKRITSQLQLLRLTNDRYPLPADGYDAMLWSSMANYEKTQAGSVDAKEHEHNVRCFMLTLKQLPASRQDAIIEKMRQEASHDEKLMYELDLLQAKRRTIIVR